MMRSYLKLARFDHWIKQLFILPGMLLAYIMDSTYAFSICAVVLTFLATCAAASANYVINEWLDAPYDKYHPIKKNRPSVTDHLSASIVYIEYILFVVIALACAWLAQRVIVFGVIVVLLIMGVIYNVKPMRTKDVTYLDVLSESINNALRFLIGWFCISPLCYPPVSFLFGYWMVGAFLMSAKRFAEYRMIGDKTQASLYRKSFKHYTEKSLLMCTIFYGFMAVFFCGVFLIKYKIELLITMPVFCGIFCYYISLCFQPDSSAQRPEKLFKEKKLMLLILIWAILVVVAYCVDMRWLDVFLRTDLVRVRVK